MAHWIPAFRSLRRHPGFAGAVILLFALGVSATTTLFSLVDAVLWKPLPYPNPDCLVTVYEANPAKNQSTSLAAPARLDDWNRLARSFEVISGSYSENVTDTSGPEPVRLAGRRVLPRFFAVFGSAPSVGRVFTDEEETFGGPLAAVISHALWQRRYQQDPGTIGRRLILGGRAYTIVGIMRDGFAPTGIDLWMPAQLSPALLRARNARFCGGVGRLRPGVTPRQGQADLARVQAALGREFPETDRGWSAEVRDLKEARVGSERNRLSLMFASVVLLLLIACANASGLMVGQLHARERELAVRSSLGATRVQLAAVVGREVAALVAGGAALGLGLSLAGVIVLQRALPNLPRIDEVRLDVRGLLFTVAAMLAALLVSGLAPVLDTIRIEPAARLHQSCRAQIGGHRLFQNVVVASQFAITLVLLLCSGLLLRSYARLARVHPGFAPACTLTFHVGAEWGEDRQAIGRMQQRLLAGLRELPGVTAAGMTNFLPASGATLRYEFTLEASAGETGTGTILAGERTIGGDYFRAIRAPVLEGVTCPAITTDPGAAVKALVNRRFVDRYGNGTPMVGRHLRFADGQGSSPGMEIVGVAGDAKEDSLDAPPFPYVYLCLPAGSWPDPDYVVRTSSDPRAALGAIRHLVRGIAPGRALFGVMTLGDYLASSLDTPRLGAEVLALFAGTALLLAAAGLYGLVMLAVTARTKEIAVHVALGARPHRIAGRIAIDAARPLLFGLAAGGVVATVAMNAPIVRSALFGVDPGDLVALLSAGGVLLTVSAAAALLPARRALAIDPIRALRDE